MVRGGCCQLVCSSSRWWPRKAWLSHVQASLDCSDGGLGLLPTRIVAVPAYVGSKADTARAAAQLPRQRSVEETTSHLPPLLSSLYAEHGMVLTDDLLVPSLLQNPGHNQSTISRALQKRRATEFWPSEEAEPCSLSVEDETKLSRLKSISTPEARAWQAILPREHELPSCTWCLWLQVWLGAAVYDAPGEGSALLCGTCGKPMDRHCLANCGTGYGRTAHPNNVALVTRNEAFVESGIPSRREEAGLLPDADDRPGDVYVTTEAGCSDPAFSSAAFDFAVHGAVRDNGKSSPLLVDILPSYHTKVIREVEEILQF